jgi:hypothetical protein
MDDVQIEDDGDVVDDVPGDDGKDDPRDAVAAAYRGRRNS